MRRPLIAGNWKMHKTSAAAHRLAIDVVATTSDIVNRVDVVLGPPHTALSAVSQAVAGSRVSVAAQDMHWADEGAFTGAISPLMVAELARFVILGHSERRALFGETDENVNRKVHAAFAHGLVPIVCVGETLAQRDAGQIDDIVTVQLSMGLDGVSQAEASRLLVAYEPVWAIGTGRPCEADEAARVCRLIRTWMVDACGQDSADAARILYGGSVTAENAGTYLRAADVDGALVGGASLDADGFAAIVRSGL